MDKIFIKVVTIVGNETGATVDQLLHDKHEEYVNYRILLIQSLHKLGYSDKAISGRLGITRQGICWLRNQFRDRVKYRLSLASHWQAIEKELSDSANDKG